MTFQNKRLIAILFSIAALLLVPLIAMQFSAQVQWTLLDFVAAGSLLVAGGLTLELLLRRVKGRNKRVLLFIVLMIFLLLVWVELAVGIFGTPFAGS